MGGFTGFSHPQNYPNFPNDLELQRHDLYNKKQLGKYLKTGRLGNGCHRDKW